MKLQTELDALAAIFESVAIVELTHCPAQDDRPETIALDCLQVRDTAPPGTGTQILTALFAVADRAGLAVWCYALPYHRRGIKAPMNQDQLVKWYEARGFRQWHGMLKACLIREPKMQ